jgi:hypothetical protein
MTLPEDDVHNEQETKKFLIGNVWTARAGHLPDHSDHHIGAELAM